MDIIDIKKWVLTNTQLGRYHSATSKGFECSTNGALFVREPDRRSSPKYDFEVDDNTTTNPGN